MTRLWAWVSGGFGFVSSVLGVVAHACGPLKVVGDVEIHPAGWALAASVAFAVLGALLVQPLIIAPRRARVARFRGLLPRVLAVRNRQVDGTQAEFEQMGLTTQDDVRAALSKLGIDFGATRPHTPVFCDMLERGALREAQKRFPLHRPSPRWFGPSGKAKNG